MEGRVASHIKNHQAHIQFEHPAANSLPGTLLEALCEALKAADENPEVRVIVLSSGGTGAFCGGASLSELKAVADPASATQFFMGFAHLINTLRILSKFVVARVHGKIVGGGVGLVSACDYVIAHEKAAVKLSELSIGIGPYVIEPAVSRKIGTTAFANLSLEAHQWKSASWAFANGLYAQVTQTEEALDLAIQKIAAKLASYAPTATKTLRALHWKDTQHWKQLLAENAKITGQLALGHATQSILKSF